VFVTDPKEPHYFAFHGTTPAFTGPGDDRMVNQAVVTDLDAYLALYPVSGYAALGEGSVSTLYYHRHAIPEVLRVNPAMRLVVLLRDPVARAWSSYQYLRTLGLEPCADFATALGEEARRKAAGWHHLWHYTAMSRYADALAAVRAAVPDAQLGIWFHDELEADYPGTVADVLRFVGVAPSGDETVGVPRVNASGAPSSRRLHRVVVWSGRQKLLRRGVRAVTTYRLRERVRALTMRRQDVPREVEALLRPRFAEDVARLRAELAVDVDRLPTWLSGPGS
jgi:hypothetical protein